MMDIATWAREYFENDCHSTQSADASRNATRNCIMQKGKAFIHFAQKCRSGAEVIGDGPKDNESKFQLVFGKNGRWILHAKDEKDYPDCYQRKVKKPAPVMLWGCISAHGMSDLHICEGTIDVEAYVGILGRHMLLLRLRLFPGTQCLFQQDNARPHSARVTTAWLRRHRVHVLDWPACLKSRSVSYWKCMAHH